MGSKSKWIGLIILLAVIGAAAVYLLLGGGPRPEPTVLRGYVGGREDRPAGGRGGTGHPGAELRAHFLKSQGRFPGHGNGGP